MDVNRESKVRRQVPADLFPGLSAIIAAHDVPVLLHEQHIRARSVHRDAVNAVADFRSRVRDMFGSQSTIDRPPRLAGIVGAEGARSRDGDEHPVRLAWINKNCVQAHSTSPW